MLYIQLYESQSQRLVANISILTSVIAFLSTFGKLFAHLVLSEEGSSKHRQVPTILRTQGLHTPAHFCPSNSPPSPHTNPRHTTKSSLFGLGCIEPMSHFCRPLPLVRAWSKCTGWHQCLAKTLAQQSLTVQRTSRRSCTIAPSP